MSRLPMLPEGKGPPPKLWRHLVTHFRRHHHHPRVRLRLLRILLFQPLPHWSGEKILDHYKKVKKYNQRKLHTLQTRIRDTVGKKMEILAHYFIFCAPYLLFESPHSQYTSFNKAEATPIKILPNKINSTSYCPLFLCLSHGVICFVTSAQKLELLVSC